VIANPVIAGRTHTEEDGMNQPDEGRRRGGQGHKTLAIRLDDDLHAQLSVLAQLENSSITELIRQAIEAHLATKRQQPDIANRAQAVLDDIEREAEARREAIAALFGSEQPEPPTPITKSARRSTKGTDEEPSES
jgi:predicted transcriptional regulator